MIVAGVVTQNAFGQDGGSVGGEVTLEGDGGPVHGAVVLIVGPGLVALTDGQGAFVIENVPAGTSATGSRSGNGSTSTGPWCS